jgi:hypothetical protein
LCGAFQTPYTIFSLFIDRHQHFARLQMCTFAFFDDRRVMVGLRSLFDPSPADMGSGVSPAIEIYAFTGNDETPVFDANEDTSSTTSRLGSLQLPGLRSPSFYSQALFYENTLSACQPSSNTQGLFYTSQEDRIFVLKITCGMVESIPCEGTLCIPQHTLRKYIRRMVRSISQNAQALDVPWMDWGPEGSRLFFNNDEQMDHTYYCCAYGSRIVTSQNTTDDEGQSFAHIILRDFSQFATASKMPPWFQKAPGSWFRYDSAENVDASLELDNDSNGVSEFFTDDVSTRLPYHVAQRTLMRPFQNEDKHLVMLSEDAILLVNNEVCATVEGGAAYLMPLQTDERHLVLLSF